ncbi:DUF4166 domain-containing protein [Bacillus paralicheniformis]|uniref:DUF4166 domain-containing protein n=1 Tax=Bacillus paralicheniformis TaxID=1648923 RepID=UPI00197BC0C3|nr:DUF4166 domain-containing protein [Bacillus paralicheniformis]QSF98967.1 DUF4166 domain-containing protein [Bacillus paralicheniformis]
MVSMYERVIEDFHLLHPKLKERYHLTQESAFRGKGVMTEISGGSYWIRLLFKAGTVFRCFFPERGRNIPFTIENHIRLTKNDTPAAVWNRTFFFRDKQRYFDAVMIYDESRGEIIDYFGHPPILISSLRFKAEADGSLSITSVRQWLPLFSKKLPLAKCLYGISRVNESYDEEKGCFTIDVHVKNPLFGTLFAYRGTFNREEEIA